MSLTQNSLKILPTSPITRALVAPPKLLSEMLTQAAALDPKLLPLIRKYQNSMKLAQDAAELLTAEIERRLRAVEGSANDVQNGTGNVIQLSDTTPLPVSAVSSVGTENLSARGDHTHEGVHSLEDLVGDIDLDGDFDLTGNVITLPTWHNEVTPAGAIDGVNVSFTLPAVPLYFLLITKNGAALYNGSGMTWVAGTNTFTTAIPPKAAVGLQPADKLRVWMAS